MATYKDIQRRTGLSLSTISKYFNDLPVREGNRRAIEEAAAALGFRRNAFARGLRTHRSRVVGVLLPALDDSFHMTVVAGIEAALRAHGVGIQVRAAHDDLVAGIEALRDQMVDGVVVVPADGVEPAAVRAAAGGLPVILLDRRLDGLVADSVTLDNEAAGALAAERLASYGHRRATVLVGPSDSGTTRDRSRGFAEGFGPDGEVNVLHTPALSVAAGHAAMTQALAGRDRPRAVFCTTFDLTLGALLAIANAGLTIPGDVSFVGSDGGDPDLATKPRLWTLGQPTAELAARTADLILARLGGDDSSPRQVVVEAELLPGDSISAPVGGRGGSRTAGWITR